MEKTSELLLHKMLLHGISCLPNVFLCATLTLKLEWYNNFNYLLEQLFLSGWNDTLSNFN